MSSSVTLKGNPVDVAGNLPKVGSTAPNFTLVDKALADVTLDSFAGKRKVLNIFPSVDTPTCDCGLCDVGLGCVAASVGGFGRQIGGDGLFHCTLTTACIFMRRVHCTHGNG